jgi:hypothetical protein
MVHRLPTLLAASALALAAPAARAQRGGLVRIEVAGVAATLQGLDLELAGHGGLGGEAQVRIGRGWFSLGLGGLLTQHHSDAVDASGDRIDSRLRSVFLEPRLSYPVSRRLAPYVLVRGGYAEYRATYGPAVAQAVPPEQLLRGDVPYSGILFGPGAGLLLRLARHLSVNAAVSYVVLGFRNPDQRSGNAVAFRLGVSFDFFGR